MSNFADPAHRYRLDSRIAVGGMGEVWRATDTVLNRTVAVKLLKPEYADDAAFQTRFEVEARHAAALHHPNVAAVFDFGGVGEEHRPYLVMELVDGQPLSALLRRGRQMPPDQATALLGQAADALAAAHRAGIVHRDVKPANLLVTPDRQLKITDFGIARAADGMTLTQTGQVMGTPQYLSPEQAEGGTATSASDVYSLGVVLFECLAGHRPYVAESPVATALAHIREPIPELPANVPADLAAVVRRCLAKNPKDRYRDAAAFAVALRNPPPAPARGETAAERTAVLGGLPPAAAYELTGTLATPVPPRRGISGWWLVIPIVLLLGLIGWAVWDSLNDEPESPPTNNTTTSSSSAPVTSQPAAETVQVDEDDYIGRPVDEVDAELSDLGLLVTRVERTNTGLETEDTVAGLSPSGTLEVGDRIEVFYWGPQPQSPSAEPSETATTTTSPGPGLTIVPPTD